MEFWVKVHNLPIDRITWKTQELLVNFLGSSVGVDLKELHGTRVGKFIKNQSCYWHLKTSQNRFLPSKTHSPEHLDTIQIWKTCRYWLQTWYDRTWWIDMQTWNEANFQSVQPNICSRHVDANNPKLGDKTIQRTSQYPTSNTPIDQSSTRCPSTRVGMSP